MKGRLIVLLAAMALLGSIVAAHASTGGVDAGVLQTYWAEGEPPLALVSVTLEVRAYGPGARPSFGKGWLKEHELDPGDDYTLDWTDVTTGHEDVVFKQCKALDPGLNMEGKTDVSHPEETRRLFNAELEMDLHFVLCVQGPLGQIREERFYLYGPEGELEPPTRQKELES
jgi:hypothetical protein